MPTVNEGLVIKNPLTKSILEGLLKTGSVVDEPEDEEPLWKRDPWIPRIRFSATDLNYIDTGEFAKRVSGVFIDLGLKVIVSKVSDHIWHVVVSRARSKRPSVLILVTTEDDSAGFGVRVRTLP